MFALNDELRAVPLERDNHANQGKRDAVSQRGLLEDVKV